MRVFKEEQRFTQPLVWIILIISFFVVTGATLNGYLEEGSTMNITDLIIVMGTYALVMLSFFFFKLITRIDEKGIHYQFIPFHTKLKSILWSEIKSVYVRRYDAITEYGGWGIKGFFGKRGKAINVKGNIGIQLELKDSKKFLIGTQLESEAKRVLMTYADKLTNEEL
jgi:hypothetical protein